MSAEVANINIENMKVPENVSAKPPPVEKGSRGKPQEKTTSQDKPLNSEEVQFVADRIQDYLDEMNISLKFSTYGENRERTSVTVVEKETGKVVREIPPEELQNLYAKMQELVGLFLNQTV